MKHLVLLLAFVPTALMADEPLTQAQLEKLHWEAQQCSRGAAKEVQTADLSPDHERCMNVLEQLIHHYRGYLEYRKALAQRE